MYNFRQVNSQIAEADQFAFVTPLDPDWVGAMPTSFFVDRAGKVVKGHAGRMLYRDLEREVLKLLEEAAPKPRPAQSGSR